MVKVERKRGRGAYKGREKKGGRERGTRMVTSSLRSLSSVV